MTPTAQKTLFAVGAISHYNVRRFRRKSLSAAAGSIAVHFTPIVYHTGERISDRNHSTAGCTRLTRRLGLNKFRELVFVVHQNDSGVDRLIRKGKGRDNHLIADTCSQRRCAV